MTPDPSSTPPPQNNSGPMIALIVLLVLIIPFVALGLGLLGKGASDRNYFQGEKVALNLQGQNTSTSTCPDNNLQILRRPTVVTALNQHINDYKSPAQRNNVPWEALAALHYRESGFRGNVEGVVNKEGNTGEGPFQLHSYFEAARNGSATISYHGNSRTITVADLNNFGTAAELTADLLQQKALYKSVAPAGSLTDPPDESLLKKAFHGYNGFTKEAHDNSSYVMNHFDAAHATMPRWNGSPDAQDGAFTVYYLLRYLGVYDDSGKLTGFKDCVQTAAGSGSAGDAGSNGSAASGNFLKVPGVKEGKQGDCGHASVMMVTRFYTPSYTDPQFYNAATNETNGSNSCVSNFYLNQHTPYHDWVFNNDLPSVGLEAIKHSLAGGDPVVFYGSPGAIFSGKHIFVIAGYDPADKTFYINNPNIHSCECYPTGGPTKTPNGKKMTEEWLGQHFGGQVGTYSHTLIIRSKYVH